MTVESTPTIVALFVAAAHALGIASAARALLTARTAQGSIAWAFSLVVLPYVALPLYWIFGPKKFHGYVEALRAERIEKREAVEAMFEGIREERETIDPEKRPDLLVFERLGAFPFTRGNDVALLVDGDATFRAIFEAIDAAKAYVLVQFFILRDDALGTALADRLVAKAKSGVRVRVLYDEVGSHSLPAIYLERLRAAGAAISSFRTTRGRWNRFQLNFRNHRKIVVVDGRVGFVGGHNVGDEYVGKDPRIGHWRDTHVRVEGPAARSLQMTFLADWYWATRELLDLDWHARLPETGQRRALVLPTGPADEREACTLFFLQAITSARKRIWIASPYFVPSLSVFDALKLAALRGVDVRVLVPAKADHLLVWLAAFSFLEAAEAVGIRIFRYRSGFMHQKVVLVDGDVASVGTANLDNRSMRLNFEVALIVADAGFAADVAAMLEADFAASRLASAREYTERGLLFRAAVNAARLFEPIL